MRIVTDNDFAEIQKAFDNPKKQDEFFLDFKSDVDATRQEWSGLDSIP